MSTNHGSRRRSGTSVRIVVLVTLVGALMLAGGSAFSAPPKRYTAVIGPSTIPAGATRTLDATLTNNASSQTLGSANLTAPSGLAPAGTASLAGGSGTATVVGNTVQLRHLGLAPGASLTVSFSVTAGCAPGVTTFGIIAKQANDFNGPPGNDFSLVAAASSLTVEITGGCGAALRFVTQPADAEKSTTISSVPADPDGPPVQVEVIDESGQRVTTSTAVITMAIGDDPNPPPGAALGGTTTRAAVAGVATFDDLGIDLHGRDYTLVATSAGLAPATSEPFTIWDQITRCEENAACTGTLQETGRTMEASVTTTSQTAGALMMSLGADALDCGDSFNHAPSVLRVDSVNLEGTKTVTLVISKKVDQAQPNNGVSFYQVCFSGEEPFVNRDGNTVPAGGVGLLPDCGAAAAPCVAAKNKISGARVAVTVTLPPGDPMMR